MHWLKRVDPDVLSLQEIRAEWDQIDSAVRSELESDFDICWFPSSSRKGYAGSAIMTKRHLKFCHTKGLNIEEYDKEGRIIVSNFRDLTFITGYFPNASSNLVRLPFKRQFSRDLIAIIQAKHALGKNIVMGGDMNVAPEEIDLARPKENRNNSGFTDEEREDFRLYLAEDMVDILRELNPTTSGLYTWWTARTNAREKNIGWRIDHFLVSRAIKDRVSNVAIHSTVLGSDHCPISIELKVE
jgi:exodeoxyribonuclease-3